MQRLVERLMTYRIKDLEPTGFAPLFALADAELKARGMTRLPVDGPNFPCRVSLRDCAIGDEVILLNHLSHAVFVSKSAKQAAIYRDTIPPALVRRILSLRAFDAVGMMVDAALAQPGEADAEIRRMLSSPDVGHIDAHNAIRGCFAARIDRT